MTAMAFGTPQTEQGYESAQEGVKVEKNTKGHNYSFRVNKKPGQTWIDVFAEIDAVQKALERRYGPQG